jgi:hypothetical protein
MEVRRETMLAAPADRVWEGICQPATMLYVLKGVFGFPSLAGRVDPIQEGERGRGWIMLFHVIPFARWTIEVAKVDPAARTIATREGGGVIRRWDHTLHVEPSPQEGCRYVDVIDVEAGPFTPAAAAIVNLIFRYRQRRLRKLARSYLAATPRPSS